MAEAAEEGAEGQQQLIVAGEPQQQAAPSASDGAVEVRNKGVH